MTSPRAVDRATQREIARRKHEREFEKRRLADLEQGKRNAEAFRAALPKPPPGQTPFRVGVTKLGGPNDA